MSTEILDCTLRDGAYINEGLFGQKTIKNIIEGLNEANIDIIECGWLKNVERDTDKTFYPYVSVLDEFMPEKKKAKFSLMLYHNEYDFKKLANANKTVDIIREIFHKNDFKNAILRSERIKDLGYGLYYQAVDTIDYSNAELMELSGLSNKIMPDCVYIVDTHGSMFREDIKRIFEILNENLSDKIKIGFHSHNNLQLSFANSIYFCDIANQKNRDIVIDSSLFGMGRGAGNLNTELMCEYLNKTYFSEYKSDIINGLINNEILKFKQIQDWGYNVNYLMTGTYNIHSRYAKYLTSKYNVNSQVLREILTIIKKDGEVFSKETADKAYDKIKSKIKCESIV